MWAMAANTKLSPEWLSDTELILSYLKAHKSFVSQKKFDDGE